MSLSFLPFSRPSISAGDIEAVVNVLRSGWITTGDRVAEFEAALCDLLGCQHAVAVSSATAAMHLSLHHLGIGPGDEVITPSLTWVSTPNLVTLAGATAVFVDVDKHTLMAGAEQIERNINEQTKLIVPVHFAGAACDLDAIHALGERYAIPVLEDCAHALGARYKNRAVGAQGNTIFSFHPIKNLTTGEGGVLCTNDSDFAAHVRSLRFHGLGLDAFDREQKGRSPQAEVIEPGFKYNLPDMNACIGLNQLHRLSSLNKRRAQLADLYHQQLAGIDELEPLARPAYDIEHAWHLYVVRLDIERSGLSRDEFIQALKQHGIGAGIHFRAVHLQHYYRKNHNPSSDHLPNTEWNSARLLSLPLFPDMHDEDVERVVDAIKKILTRAKK